MTNRFKWKDLIKALEEIVTVYECYSDIVSLGFSSRYRKLLIKHAWKISGYTIDGGSGPGSLSEIILRSKGKEISMLILIDPSLTMLRVAKIRLKNNYKIETVVGIFEHMPFRENSINCILCSYSIRDSINIQRSLKELWKTLKVGGVLSIVDMSKPDELIFRLLIALYWKIIPKLLISLINRKLSSNYALLYETYLRMPRNKDFLIIFRKLFRSVYFKPLLGGAAMIINALKYVSK